MFTRSLTAYVAALFFVLCGIFPAAAAKPGDAYTVMLLGDTHFDDGKYHLAPLKGWRLNGQKRCLEMWERRSPELLAAAGKRAAAERVVLAVQLGDLVNGECDNPELLNKLFLAGFSEIKKYFPGMPLTAVKGNHDIRTVEKFRNNAPIDAALKKIVSAELGRELEVGSCYSFRRGDDLFIVADGFITAGEIVAFVRTTLEKNPSTRYVFFLTHMPLIPASVKYPFWLLPGHVEVMEMLEKRNAVVIAAHTHVASYAVRHTAGGELPQLVVTSMGSEWDPGKIIPPKFDSWESFSKASRARAVPRDRYNPAEMWDPLEKRGVYTFRQLFGNSGFAVLDVDDDRVEVRYYTDDSGTPSETLRLPNKHK
jgi:hypothetical protein